MIIADTTVLIDIHRGRDEIKPVLAAHSDDIVCISAITLKELYFGLGFTRVKMGDETYEKQKNKILQIISDFHVIEISNEILKLAGLKAGELLASGNRPDFEDVIIGITAEMVNAQKIITRTPDHFKAFKIPVEIYTVKTTSELAKKIT